MRGLGLGLGFGFELLKGEGGGVDAGMDAGKGGDGRGEIGMGWEISGPVIRIGCLHVNIAMEGVMSVCTVV